MSDNDTRDSGFPDIPGFLRRTPPASGLHEAASGNHEAGPVFEDDDTMPPTLEEQAAKSAAAFAAHQAGQGEPGPAPHQIDLEEAIAAATEAAPTPVEEPEADEAPVGNLTHNPNTNQSADLLKDFFKDIRSFGRASGEGASALPRLYLRAVRAAADGLISTEKPQGGGKDDAAVIYETYTAEDSKKAEHTAGGAKANASKLRQVIGLGTMTTVDGVAIADATVRLWEKMTAEELKPKPLAQGLVDVARAQMSEDTPLDDDGIIEALSKTPPEKTLEKEWAGIHKKITGLISGENPAKLKDDSGTAVQIEELVRTHVTKFVVAEQGREFIKLCMERGFSREQAEDMAAGHLTK